jgi:hypothetical protein
VQYLSLLTRFKKLKFEDVSPFGIIVFAVSLIWMFSNFLTGIGLDALGIKAISIGILFGSLYLIFFSFRKIYGILQPGVQFLSVPIYFMEPKYSKNSSNMFNSFLNSSQDMGDTFKELEEKSKLGIHDLIVSFNNSNLRTSIDAKDWASSINEMLWDWEKIDRKLMEAPFANKNRCYHLVPHIPLPLSFSLGAAINKRRPLVLYHHQDNYTDQECNCKYYPVMDLSDLNEIFEEPDPTFILKRNISIMSIPENLNDLTGGEKLIFHIILVPNHNQNFQLHPDYKNADNAALICLTSLDPMDDWLPYVQLIVQKAGPLISKYKNVEVCLRCPDVIAFSLGIAFSRNPGLKICALFTDKTYNAVFSLSEIEQKLPFS